MPLELLGIVGAALVAIGTACYAWSEAIVRRNKRETAAWATRMRHGK